MQSPLEATSPMSTVYVSTSKDETDQENSPIPTPTATRGLTGALGKWEIERFASQAQAASANASCDGGSHVSICASFFWRLSPPRSLPADSPSAPPLGSAP